MGEREGGREGEREGGREGGREGRREGGRERGREGGRERGREGGREGRRERGREGGGEGESTCIYSIHIQYSIIKTKIQCPPPPHYKRLHQLHTEQLLTQILVVAYRQSV